MINIEKSHKIDGMQIADKGCRQVSLTRDSRHGFKFPSLIPATSTTFGVCIVKSKINLTTWAGGGLLFRI